MQQREMQRKKAPVRRRKNRNGNTLLWLFLCYPVGLTKMWKNSCTWRPGVKYAVSSLALIAVAAVMLYPSPSRNVPGGIELVGQKPAVKVYGPELPDGVIHGYSQQIVASVVAPEATEAAAIQRVYASKDQDCYHTEKCKYAYASAQYLTLYEATLLGYTPCGLCNPPAYAG